MDRAVLLTTGEVLQSGSLRLGAAAPSTASPPTTEDPVGYPESTSLADVEVDHIRRVLAASGGHIGKASGVLGIHRNTLARKVQEYGLESGV
jgi:DNA-binding NtrC family response regulator